MLIENLPRGAALSRALHGDDAEWGLTEHLLAAVVDQLAISNWLFATAHTPEHTAPPERPDPIPRPGLDVAEPTSPSASPEQIAAFFGASAGR